MENRLHDVLEWHDGYNFAEHRMLCPWTVLKFLSRALDTEHDPAVFQPENYRANSSGNDIIEICMKHPRPKDAEPFQHLLEGKTEEIALREFTACPAITADTDFDTFATLMLHTGYLTVTKDAVPSEKTDLWSAFRIKRFWNAFQKRQKRCSAKAIRNGWTSP